MKAAFSKRAVVSILGGLLASCATTSKRVQFTPDEVVADLATRVPEDVVQKVVVPYDINDEIRDLARKSVDSLRTDTEKTRAIVNAIISRTGMSISYDWLSNKTAQQVFYEGRGNCLAYSNLFIGMAREVGLDAVYVDVTTIERISKEAEVIVNNGHITAGIRYGPELVMIDFTRTPEREYMGAKVIDDFEAIANYYNNQGFLYGYYAETAGDMGDEFDPADGGARDVQDGARRPSEFRAGAEQPRRRLEAARKGGRRHRAIQARARRRSQIRRGALQPRGGVLFTGTGRRRHPGVRDGGARGRLERVLLPSPRRDPVPAGELRRGAASVQESHFPRRGLADSRYYLGETYLKLGDREKAIEAYRKTLEVDPNYLSARAKLDMLVTETNIKSD